MKLYTDDYFHIGAAHLGAGLPCQDYALSRALEEGSMAYAIISDGCSTGGRTDVGSRIISHTAEVAIGNHWKRYADATVEGASKEISLHQQVLLTTQKSGLGIGQRDLLATCTYAFLSNMGGFVHMRGDGVIAIVRRDGVMSVRRYDWARNMPLYPAYFEDNFAGFIAEQNSKDPSGLFEEHWVYVGDSFQHLKTSSIPVHVGVHGVTIPIGERVLADDLAFIVLFTDGVMQVDGMDWKDAVLSLVSFKNVVGSFAKRRMIRFIQDAQKKGKGPMDDIAYAVIRIDTEEEGHGS